MTVNLGAGATGLVRLRFTVFDRESGENWLKGRQTSLTRAELLFQMRIIIIIIKQYKIKQP